MPRPWCALGGFFPWSAWDLSKALSIALTLTLAWSWILRQTRSRLAACLGAFLVVLGGGARWLLLLVPPSVLQWISNGIQLTNTATGSGTDLFTVLSRPWLIEGSGPFPFPFAYHSGIFVPVTFALGSSGAMPYFTVILLLILVNRRHLSAAAVVPLSLVFSHPGPRRRAPVRLPVGGAGPGGLSLFADTPYPAGLAAGQRSFPWAAILAISAVLCVIQGGFLTEAVRNLLAEPARLSYRRWATTTITRSSRAGRLPSTRRISAPFPCSIPGSSWSCWPSWALPCCWPRWATRVAWRGLHRQRWLAAGLGLAALASFVMPLFFQYGVERSGTRLPATALWLWLLLAAPSLWRALAGKGRFSAPCWAAWGTSPPALAAW